MFSVCVLCYGEHTNLARRCLTSLLDHPAASGTVRDIRIGLNSPALVTCELVKSLRDDLSRAYAAPVITYVSPVNVLKYPMMRLMFHDHQRPLDDFAMWFDDDSYITDRSFWTKVCQAAEQQDMLGQQWYLPLQGQQWEWIKTQPWFNPAIGLPHVGRVGPRRTLKPRFYFCTGGWWVLRRSVIEKYNWPIPELRHRGGDSLLGELIRHQGLRMARFEQLVRINADDQGRHSKAPRRGCSKTEREIGVHYSGRPLPTNHHTFPYMITQTSWNSLSNV